MSRNSIKPRPDIVMLFTRVSPEFAERLCSTIDRHGYRSRSEFLKHALAAFLYLRNEGPEPDFNRRPAD